MKDGEKESTSLAWIFESLKSLPNGTSIRFYKLESDGIGIGFTFPEGDGGGGLYVDEYCCDIAVTPETFELECVRYAIDRANSNADDPAFRQAAHCW